MLIIILKKGTRLFCSSSLGLVTLISTGEIQDGCTVIKVYIRELPTLFDSAEISLKMKKIFLILMSKMVIFPYSIVWKVNSISLIIVQNLPDCKMQMLASL